MPRPRPSDADLAASINRRRRPTDPTEFEFEEEEVEPISPEVERFTTRWSAPGFGEGEVGGAPEGWGDRYSDVQGDPGQGRNLVQRSMNEVGSEPDAWRSPQGFTREKVAALKEKGRLDREAQGRLMGAPKARSLDPRMTGEIEDPMLSKMVAGVGSAAEKAAGQPTAATAGMEEVRGKSPLVARHLESMMQGATPPAPPTDPDADLNRALDERREGKMWEGLINAGRKIGRAGSRTSSTPVDLDTEAPLEELDLRQSSQDRARKTLQAGEEWGLKRGKMQSDADKLDPKSKTSASARAQLVAVYPAIAKRFSPDDLAGMSAADIERLFSEIQQEKKTGTGAGVKPKDQKALGEDVETENRLNANIQRLQDAVAEGKRTGDTPGGGRLDSSDYVPDELKIALRGGTADIDVEQASKGVVGDLIYKMSGKAASAAEMKRISESYGLKPGGSQPAFEQGVQKLVEDAGLMSKGMVAKHQPHVWAEYMKQGGELVTPRAAQAPSPVAPAGGGVEVITTGEKREGFERVRDPKTGRMGWRKVR